MNIHSVGEEKYATKPESNWDAGANNTPRTKQVASRSQRQLSEHQKRSNQWRKKLHKLSSSSIRSQPLSTAVNVALSCTKVPSDPTKNSTPVPTVASTRKRHLFIFSSSSNDLTSWSSTSFSKVNDQLLKISKAIIIPYTIDEVTAPTYNPTDKNEVPLNI